MTRRDLAHVLLGAVLVLSAMGWWSEFRVRLAERAGYERWEARAVEHMAIMDGALRLAAQNPVERGLAISEAVTIRDYLKRTAKHPSVRDDGLTDPPHRAAAPARPARSPQAVKGSPGARENQP